MLFSCAVGQAFLFFTSCCSLGYVSANVPTFTVRPQSVIVTEGETVRLPCSASGTPTPALSWTFGSRYLQPHSDGTLTIKPVTKSDEGTYVCTVSNVNGRRETSATVTVNLRYEPYFTTAPQNTTAAEGSTVKLPCAAVGTPSPIISWRKINDHLPRGYSKESEYLTLPHVNKSASGVFQCTSINAHGSVSVSAMLTVLDPIIFKKTPRDHNGNIGETALLECLIDPKGTPATINWLKDDIPIDPSTAVRYSIIAGGSLLINSLQREDMARYTCSAQGAVGTANASAVVLLPGARQPAFTTTPASALVPPTETVKLDCAASGVPDPQLTWTKDRKSLTDVDGRYTVVGSQLIIVSARMEDSGNFTCTASNLVGTVSTSVIVSVAVPRPTTPAVTPILKVTEETEKELSLIYIIALAAGITGGVVIIIIVILIYCCCLRTRGATIQKALTSPSFASWQNGGVDLGSVPPSYFTNPTFDGLGFQTFDTANQMLLERLHNLEVDTHSSDKFQQALVPDWASPASYDEDEQSEDSETDESEGSETEEAETSPDTRRRPPRGSQTIPSKEAHRQSKDYRNDRGKSTGYRRDSNHNQQDQRVSSAYRDSGSSTKRRDDRRRSREYQDETSLKRHAWDRRSKEYQGERSRSPVNSNCQDIHRDSVQRGDDLREFQDNSRASQQIRGDRKHDDRSSKQRSPSHADSGYDETTTADYRHSRQESRRVDRRLSADDADGRKVARRGGQARGSSHQGRRYSEDVSRAVIRKASDQGPLDTIQHKKMRSGENERGAPRKSSSRKLNYDQFSGRENGGRKHSPTSLTDQRLWSYDQQMLY